MHHYFIRGHNYIKIVQNEDPISIVELLELTHSKPNLNVLVIT